MIPVVLDLMLFLILFYLLIYSTGSDGLAICTDKTEDTFVHTVTNSVIGSIPSEGGYRPIHSKSGTACA